MILVGLLVVATAGGMAWWHWLVRSPHPNHVVSDRVLRGRGVVIYTPSAAPRALMLFFGNDIGFWRPHHELAADLAAQGYAVAGIDIRPLFDSLPEEHAARDSACARVIRDIALRVSRELALDSTPVIIGGHSLGAELAVWAAARAGVPRVVGVLALSIGSRSHLRVTRSDILMTSEPEGPESFGVAELVGELVRSHLRVAIIRGSHDKFGTADAALLGAGGALARRFSVPFASHSLRDLTLARYVIRDAMEWLLQPGARGAGRVARDGARSSDHAD